MAGTLALADVDLQWLEHERWMNTAFRDTGAASAYRMVTAELGDAVAGGESSERHLTATPFVPPAGVDRAEACREIFEIQATGLARRLVAARAKTAVIGVSGGLDSTLALLVVLHAMEKLGRPASDIVAVTMPGLGTSDRTRDNAVELSAALGVTLRRIPIGAAVALAHGYFTGDPSLIAALGTKFINFPELIDSTSRLSSARVTIDGKAVPVELLEDLRENVVAQHEVLK